MVAFLVVFGFLAFGCAVVGWGTRHVWTPDVMRRMAKPSPARTLLPVLHQPAPFGALSIEPPTALTAHAEPPVESPAFDVQPAAAPEPVEPPRRFAAAADPFAHAPPLSQTPTGATRH